MSKSLRADAVTGLHNAYIEHLRNNGDIQSSRVEEAFRAVPRHLFLPDVPLERVYSDESILTKLQDGEVVSSSSQPAMMAIMLEQLDLQPGHHVLEVGAATGYNAGLMAHLVGDSGQMTTIDIDEDLVEGAREHLAAAGLASVTTVCGDGGLGYPDHAPYDRIILTVGAWDIVPAWWEQLRPGGRLLLPLEVRGGIQKSVAFDRIDDHLVSSSVNDCGFMPLRGDFAKPPDSIPLGPDPGLILSVDDPGRVDADAVYGLLSDPTELRSTGIRVSPREVIFGGDWRSGWVYRSLAFAFYTLGVRWQTAGSYPVSWNSQENGEVAGRMACWQMVASVSLSVRLISFPRRDSQPILNNHLSCLCEVSDHGLNLLNAWPSR